MCPCLVSVSLLPGQAPSPASQAKAQLNLTSVLPLVFTSFQWHLISSQIPRCLRAFCHTLRASALQRRMWAGARRSCMSALRCEFIGRVDHEAALLRGGAACGSPRRSQGRLHRAAWRGAMFPPQLETVSQHLLRGVQGPSPSPGNPPPPDPWHRRVRPRGSVAAAIVD